MATVKEDPTTSSGYSSKTQMPEIILCNHFQAAVSSQQFVPKMEFYEFDTARSNLKDRISQYQSLFKRSLEDHQRNNSSELEAQFERKLIELIRNSCSAEFLKLHARQIAGLATAEKVLDYIENVFGEETDEIRKERAEEDLRKIARRADKGEKFSAFLKRIEIIVADIDQEPKVREFLADNIFRKNIEPANLTFLKDNMMHRKSAREISEFLDNRERFLCAQVSFLETDRMNYFIDQATQNIGDKLTGLCLENNKSIDEKQNKIEQKVDRFAAVVEQLTATISQLEAEKRQQFQSQAQPYHQSVSRFQNPGPYIQPQANFGNNFGHHSSFQPQRFSGPQNPNGPYCSECKSYGHIKRNCRRIVCNNCHERGHIARFCNKPRVENQGQQVQQGQQGHQGPPPNPQMPQPPRNQNSGN
jgi:hypothetical protein